MNQGPGLGQSLRVASELLSVKELEALLGCESIAGSDDYWLVDLEENSFSEIDEVLASVTSFFDQNIEIFHTIKEKVQVELRIGWAPSSGLAGVAIEKDLIRLLAESGAELLLDIYGDSS